MKPGKTAGDRVRPCFPASRALPLVSVLWLLSLTSGTTLAAEPAPPAKQPSAESEPAPKAQSDAAADEGEAEKADEASKDEKSKGEKAGAADRKASPQRFVPSEQVRADFDVSFPIDI